MTAKTNPHNKVYVTLGIMLAIVLFVIVLILIIRSTQVSYSHKVVSITFTSDSGPVSPEYQQAQILALTPGSCQFTTTKVSPESTTSTPCTITTQNFQKVVDSYNSYNVADKLQSAEGGKPSQLLGGKRQTISVQLQDGTVLTAAMTPELKDSLQPFLDDVILYVPQMSQLQF